MRMEKRRSVRQDFPGGGWIEPVAHLTDRPRLPYVVRFAQQDGNPIEEGFRSFEEASLRHLQIRATATSLMPAMSRTFDDAAAVMLLYHPRGSLVRTRCALRKHLLPVVGEIRLVDVDEHVIARFRRSIAESTSVRRHNELARWFEAIMAQAQNLGWVPPERTYLVPRRAKLLTPAKRSWLDLEKKDVRPSRQAIDRVLEHSKDLGMLRIFLLLGLRAGLRIGETFALQWGEVDLEVGILRVRAAIRSVPSSEAEIAGERLDGRTEQKVRSAPKTRTSFRSIELHPDLLAALAAWRTDACTEDDLVLFRPGDRILDMATVRERFFKFLVSIGLATARSYLTPGGHRRTAYDGAFRVHDLRHACVALWIWEGHDVEEIMRWIGHSDIEMTLDTYGYLLEAHEAGADSWPVSNGAIEAEPMKAQLIELDGQFYREPYRPAPQ